MNALLGVNRSVLGRRWLARPLHLSHDAELRAMTHQGVSELLARVLASRGVRAEDSATHLRPRLHDLMPDPSSLADMNAAVECLLRAIGVARQCAPSGGAGGSAPRKKAGSGGKLPPGKKAECVESRSRPLPDAGHKIAVFADYDVDGAASCALLVRYLRALGIQAHIHIPDRTKEGYGPSRAAFEHLHAEGVRLIILVDCGTNAQDACLAAGELGLELLILDHHEPPQSSPPLPAVRALVNPKRHDDTSGLHFLASAGVVFFFLAACNRALREGGYFTDNDTDSADEDESAGGDESEESDAGKEGDTSDEGNENDAGNEGNDGADSNDSNEVGISEPKLMPLLDLVALATVCDVVPLTPLNRAFIRGGLLCMGRSGREGNSGLAALLEIDERMKAGARAQAQTQTQEREMTAEDFAFFLGPRLNAGGRMGTQAQDSSLAARLLSTDDTEEALALALRLEALNQTRRRREEGITRQALRQAEEDAENAQGLVFVCDKAWPPGLVGIVANRLKDRYQRACVVVGNDGENSGFLRGSCRSIAGFDMGALILEAVEAGILLNGGGHKMAAGFTVAEDKLAEFRGFMRQQAARHDHETAASAAADCHFDGVLGLRGLLHVCDLLRSGGPYGVGNEEPRFAFASLRVLYGRTFGQADEHIACVLESGDGERVRAVAFHVGVGAAPLREVLLRGGGSRFHVAGRLQANDYRGRRNVQLLIDDIALDSSQPHSANPRQ